MSFEVVEREMDAAVSRRVFPGAVLLVREGTRVCYLRAFGHRSLEPEVTPMAEGTIFDVVLADQSLRDERGRDAAREGRQDPPRRPRHALLPQFRCARKDARHLPPPAEPFLGAGGVAAVLQRNPADESAAAGSIPRQPGAKDYVYQTLQRERLEGQPGKQAVYSDLGFMVLGNAIEEVSGMPLDRFCHERIFRPLGLRAPDSSTSPCCARGASKR